MIEVYTDGSCNSVTNIGAWVAILFVKGEKTILKDRETNTTHQRMELLAVNRALQYIRENCFPESPVRIYSDSQYVIGIPVRKEKLEANNFLTKQREPVRNVDLIRDLINFIKTMNVVFIKVKAHQKVSAEKPNYNREADKLARRLSRQLLT